MVPPSLRKHLTLHLLTLIWIVLVISGLFSYVQALRFSNVSYDHALLENMRGVTQQVQVKGTEVHINLTPQAIDMLRSDSRDTIYYQVRSQKRGILSGDDVLPEPPIMDWSNIPADGEGRPTYYNTTIRGEQVRVVALPMAVGPGGEPIVVQLGETRNKRDSMAGDIVLAVVAPQLALLVLSWFAIQRGVSSSLAPLEKIAQIMKNRQRDELMPLPANAVPEETRPLMDAFNLVLERLREATDTQRRFVADAAHQLRTPLATLRILLERALREPDHDAREALMSQLVGAIDRITRLSSQLLLLSRAEPGTAHPPQVLLDLRALAFDVGSQWVPRALSLGYDLGFAAPDEAVTVRGDAIMLGELINNLIDNALKYGGPHITLRLVPDSGRGAALSVEDDGAGIPPAERERIFERFHRAPGSYGEGSGLGLAIVREIAHGHGAEVELSEPVWGGICFTIRFPPV